MPGTPPSAGEVNSRATNRGQIMCYLHGRRANLTMRRNHSRVIAQIRAHRNRDEAQMPPVRNLGRLFDALVGHIDGRRARVRRNGWLFVLALILLAAVVVTPPPDYAGARDPT